MPIYEYICEQCGNKFDKIRPMSEADAPIECEHCHSNDTHRALSRCYCKSDSSGGLSSSSSSSGCSGCSGGSCSSCHH